jgi:hypothetical protein
VLICKTLPATTSPSTLRPVIVGRGAPGVECGGVSLLYAQANSNASSDDDFFMLHVYIYERDVATPGTEDR